MEVAFSVTRCAKTVYFQGILPRNDRASRESTPLNITFKGFIPYNSHIPMVLHLNGIMY